MEKYDLYKQEMINRYSYLFENAFFIFCYFMRNETTEEYNKYKELKSKVSSLDDYFALNLNLIDSYNLYMLESIIFENKSLEDTMGYKYFETIKYEFNTLEKVKNGEKLRDEYNLRHKNDPLEFDVIELLFDIYENIARQSSDIDNKEKKLKIMDEYIRIAKYTNDYRIWRGGYFLSGSDHISNNPDYKYKFNGINLLPKRFSYDIGIGENELVDITKDIIFSEDDKRQLYFKYHDEIPYDLEIRCSSNGILEIDRPYYSKPCNRPIYLKEQKIISLERENDFVFLTLCPACLYIVGVNSNLIPLEIQKEIVLENKNNPLIYEEAYLESELKSLKKEKYKPKH